MIPLPPTLTRHALVALLLLTATSGAMASEYPLTDDLTGPGSRYIVRHGDSLYDIARRFDVGGAGLIAANPGLRPARLKTGDILTIPDAHILPAVREGIVIDLARLRLFYFEAGSVATYPISVGKQGWATPSGMTSVVKKRKDPVWRPPDSIRKEDPTLPDMVPAGPENPLGAYAMNLGWPGYALHGTNNPASIGKRVSHGCIRLYPEDIESLFQKVPVGTSVTIVDAPFHLGWHAGGLYLEISNVMKPEFTEDLFTQISAFESPELHIDWALVRKALKQKTGAPVQIGRQRGAVLGENERW